MSRPDFTGERVVIGRADEWSSDPLAAEHVARYTFARDVLPGRQRVVDVACGTGFGSALLAESGHSVIGIDSDPESIEFAKSEWPEATFERGDAANMSLASGSVDAVVSFETIEHVDDPRAFLLEIVRVLTPTGSLVMSTPDRPVYASRNGNKPNPFHNVEFSREELSALLAPYFTTTWYGQTLHRPRIRLRKLGPVREAWARRRQGPERFEPRPLDDQPWVFLVVVARRTDAGFGAAPTDGLP